MRTVKWSQEADHGPGLRIQRPLCSELFIDPRYTCMPMSTLVSIALHFIKYFGLWPLLNRVNDYMF